MPSFSLLFAFFPRTTTKVMALLPHNDFYSPPLCSHLHDIHFLAAALHDFFMFKYEVQERFERGKL
jgi:hypothetical protein